MGIPRNLTGRVLGESSFKCIRVTRVVETIGTAKNVDPKCHERGDLKVMCLLKHTVRSVNPSTPLRANGLVEGGGCIGHYPDTTKEGT